MKALLWQVAMLSSLWLARAEQEREVLAGAIADNCKVRGDVLTCLQLMMLANVSDMARADVYHLTDGLVVEKVNDLAPLDLTQDIQRLRKDKDVSLGTALLVGKTLDTFRSHVLHWRLLPGVDVTVFRHPRTETWDLALEEHAADREERHFGARRRIVMIMLPLMYKLGVVTAMLAGLTFLTLKGVTIGVILLILAFGNLFKSKGHHEPHWAPRPPLAADIHVHVHTGKEHEHAQVGWEPPSAHQEYQHHPYRRYDVSPYRYSFNPTVQA